MAGELIAKLSDRTIPKQTIAIYALEKPNL